jgi:hypothetical protein
MMTEAAKPAGRRVTFEVDKLRLFDALSAMNGETDALGLRLVATLVSGRASFADRWGLGVYGITVIEEETEG